ncbi:hypothetical protein JAO76_08315 [Pontibacter sp. BT310]|jgi:hypothetical protein|uniref:DUF1440 domain-containing protein n=1 Tax=Pontibacter populi TaxID=890055 RepID=A0ABS6XAQ8_9BACT|nr:MULTISPECIES: hypothetical protein [Pontibacter]MBJ6118191.1 hypothetical protein [Pontibacter sp. BT310]MBR0570618.1 hypothetical protein [Microvirga sp. STS03]MBW3365044.1 hypothetical protein [Pontibacter populi]
MNISDLFLWGFAATLVLTVLLSASRPLGLTRMDLPFMLGTLFTSNRNNAPWLGFMAHLLMGWFFALIYGAAFESTGIASWWFGAAIGLVHGAFVLTVGLQIMNYIHPRMARPYQGPTPTRQLEPPGFLALNYGKGTPLITLLGHLVYGGILGTFYS